MSSPGHEYLIMAKTLIARRECRACGHALTDADYGTCPNAGARDGSHKFVEVAYAPATQLQEALDALRQIVALERDSVTGKAQAPNGSRAVVIAQTTLDRLHESVR